VRETSAAFRSEKVVHERYFRGEAVKKSMVAGCCFVEPRLF
jgi:hypothetical protein